MISLKVFRRTVFFGIERINPGYFPLIYCNSLCMIFAWEDPARIVLVSATLYLCIPERLYISKCFNYSKLFWFPQNFEVWLVLFSFLSKLWLLIFFSKFFLKFILILAVPGLQGCVGFSLVMASGGTLHLRGSSFSLRSGSAGFRSCRTQIQGLQLPGSRAHVQGLWPHGLSCPATYGDGTLVSYTGRWILYLWATREACFSGHD